MDLFGSNSSPPKIKLNTNGNTFFSGGSVTIDGGNVLIDDHYLGVGELSSGSPWDPTTNPRTFLHVKGSTEGKYHHVALIENTNSSVGAAADNGLAIKLAVNNPNRFSNFITFYDIDEDGTLYGGSLGAIEGQTYQDLEYDPWYEYELSQITLEYYNEVGNNLMSVISGALGAIPLVGSVIGGIVEGYINNLISTAYYEQRMELYDNIVTDNLGVCYKSGSADYAEYLERLYLDEKITPGCIVGVHNGMVSKKTTNASEILVVSNAPGVLGIMPTKKEEYKYEKVAFMGQVPVFVKGAVNPGDFIIASGNNDGLGLAIPPELIEISQFKNIVGTAWSGSGKDKINIINLSLGVGKDMITMAEIQNERMNEIELRLLSLEQKMDNDILISSNNPCNERIQGNTKSKFPKVLTQNHEMIIKSTISEALMSVNDKNIIYEKMIEIISDDLKWNSFYNYINDNYNNYIQAIN